MIVAYHSLFVNKDGPTNGLAAGLLARQAKKQAISNIFTALSDCTHQGNLCVLVHVIHSLGCQKTCSQVLRRVEQVLIIEGEGGY